MISARSLGMGEYVMVRGQLKKNASSSLKLLKDYEYPHTTDDLLEILKETFPPTSPQKDETMSELMFRGGQRSVGDWLIVLKERSEQ